MRRWYYTQAGHEHGQCTKIEPVQRVFSSMLMNDEHAVFDPELSYQFCERLTTG
jgi:hypothetical protein